VYSRASQVLRGLGRAVTAVGLLLFWVRVVVLAVSKGDPIPAALGQTGFVLAAAGCIGLAAIVALLFPPRPKVGFDVILGLACALTGVIGLLLVLGDAGIHVGLAYSVFTAGLLIVGGFGLAFASVVRPRQKRSR
jgi:hypothetical protein